MKRDITKGNILSNLLFMAVPTMLGFLSHTLYDFVDMIWIGRISFQAVAAVGIFATIFWLVDILNEIIGVSSISIISQRYGKGDLEGTRKAIEQTVTFKWIMAAIAAVLFWFALEPFAHFFSKDPEVINYILEYGRVRVFFLPFMFSSYTVYTALRCIGDSKKPMYLMGASALLNVILDPIFMFDSLPINLGFTQFVIPGLGLGVYRAALATVVATFFAFVTGFYILISGRTHIKISIRGLFRLDPALDRQLLTIGLPSGLEMVFRNGSAIFILKLISLYGTPVVAAYSIVNRMFGVVIMPLLGMSMGGSTIVGQCLGQDNIDRAKQTAITAASFGVGVMLALTGLAAFGAEPLMGIFTDNMEVISEGVMLIRIGMFSMVFLGITFGLGIVFTGSGWNMPMLISGIASRWIIQLPFSYLAAVVLGWPVWTLWLGMVISEVTEALVIFVAFKWDKWKTHRVAEEGMETA